MDKVCHKVDHGGRREDNKNFLVVISPICMHSARIGFLYDDDDDAMSCYDMRLWFDFMRFVLC